MTKSFENLMGKEINLVCFGEYVGFIHIGGNDHFRIESDTVIVGPDGSERIIFPEPELGTLSSILGSKIKSAKFSNFFRLFLDNDSIIKVSINDGYESLMISIDGKSVFY